MPKDKATGRSESPTLLFSVASLLGFALNIKTAICAVHNHLTSRALGAFSLFNHFEPGHQRNLHEGSSPVHFSRKLATGRHSLKKTIFHERTHLKKNISTFQKGIFLILKLFISALKCPMGGNFCIEILKK